MTKGNMISVRRSTSGGGDDVSIVLNTMRDGAGQGMTTRTTRLFVRGGRGEAVLSLEEDALRGGAGGRRVLEDGDADGGVGIPHVPSSSAAGGKSEDQLLSEVMMPPPPLPPPPPPSKDAGGEDDATAGSSSSDNHSEEGSGEDSGEEDSGEDDSDDAASELVGKPLDAGGGIGDGAGPVPGIPQAHDTRGSNIIHAGELPADLTPKFNGTILDHPLPHMPPPDVPTTTYLTPHGGDGNEGPPSMHGLPSGFDGTSAEGAPVLMPSVDEQPPEKHIPPISGNLGDHDESASQDGANHDGDGDGGVGQGGDEGDGTGAGDDAGGGDDEDRDDGGQDEDESGGVDEGEGGADGAGDADHKGGDENEVGGAGGQDGDAINSGSGDNESGSVDNGDGAGAGQDSSDSDGDAISVSGGSESVSGDGESDSDSADNISGKDDGEGDHNDGLPSGESSSSEDSSSDDVDSEDQGDEHDHEEPPKQHKNPDQQTSESSSSSLADCAGTLFLSPCRIRASFHDHPSATVFVVFIVAILCYRWRRFATCGMCGDGSSPGDRHARGEYRAVAARYTDGAFVDDFSPGENDDYLSDEEYADADCNDDGDDDGGVGGADGGWNRSNGRRVIEMKSLGKEVNGGLTLEETNG